MPSPVPALHNSETLTERESKIGIDYEPRPDAQRTHAWSFLEPTIIGGAGEPYPPREYRSWYQPELWSTSHLQLGDLVLNLSTTQTVMQPIVTSVARKLVGRPYWSFYPRIIYRHSGSPETFPSNHLIVGTIFPSEARSNPRNSP